MSILDVPATCERFKKLYTGIIGDILDKMGFRNQILPYYIQAVTGTGRVAGPAFTSLGHPVDDPTNNDMDQRLKMLDSITPNSISVLSSGGHLGSAHWGEIMSVCALERGCQGAVVDGGVRDVELISALDFPLFARFRSPASSLGRWETGEWGIPVKIGPTTINPGDFVFGDSDGVVVVPQDIVAEVLVAGEAVARREEEIRLALRQGVPATQAYGR